jgi:hypothetical protein
MERVGAPKNGKAPAPKNMGNTNCHTCASLLHKNHMKPYATAEQACPPISKTGSGTYLDNLKTSSMLNMITKDMLPKAVEVATGPHPNASDAAGAKPVSILYINNMVIMILDTFQQLVEPCNV